MAFDVAVNNPASQNYDYQSGRGLDSFMSAAIDAVSWETSLGSVYNTLSQAPVGQSAYNNSTALNYDSAQVSGSQSQTATVGGGGGAAAGSAGSSVTNGGVGFQINATSNNATVNDGNTNRVLIGQNPTTNTWGMFAVPAGSDVKNAQQPSQFSLSTDFTSLLVVINQQIQFPSLTGTAGNNYFQVFTVPHGQNSIPSFLAYILINFYQVFVNSPAQGLPVNYWASIASGSYAITDGNLTSYQYFAGVDINNFYCWRLVTTGNVSGSFTAVATTASFQILQQTSAANQVSPSATYNLYTTPQNLE